MSEIDDNEKESVRDLVASAGELLAELDDAPTERDKPNPFEELAKGHPRIDFLKPVFHDEAIQLISQCSAYVVASRTEGFPRVLYEAMAAQKPFIASAIDGIPYYVRDGENGLLFESENDAELADKIRLLLRDPALCRRLGECGRKFAESELSETAYLNKFREMLDSTLEGQ